MISILLALALSATAVNAANAVDHAWSILKAATADKNPVMRAKAVQALGLLKVSQAQQMAQKALSDNDKDVRVEAATALGRMGLASSRPALRQALKDKELKVVLAAANALYLLKDPAAYDVYYAVLTGERKGPGLIQSQMDMLRDRKQVEKLAFETGIGFVPFGGIGYETWKTIMHDDSSAIRVQAAERLAGDPDPKSADALINNCADKHWQVRLAVVEAIAKRGDPALLDPALALLGDDNDAVRYDAAATVIRLSRGRPAGPPAKTSATSGAAHKLGT